MIKQGARVISEYKSGVLKLTLLGEIDHHNAKALREKTDEEIFRSRPQKVEINLSEVDFMDSSGLGLIIGRYSTASEVGSTLTVKNPSAQVEKVIALAGLDRIIKIEKS